MKNLFTYLKGDRAIWAITAVLFIMSVLAVFSANGQMGFRHVTHLALGFAMMFVLHTIPYKWLKRLSLVGVYVVIPLLFYTLLQGTTIGDANASRWIHIPLIGSFQPSELAKVVILILIARFLAKHQEDMPSLAESIVPLFLPIGLICFLILPTNLSTTALIFMLCVFLLLVGGYPLKQLGILCGSGVLFFSLFVSLVLLAPDFFPNRVQTWISRVECFLDDDCVGDASYQVDIAKQGIAQGGFLGKGPGKSMQKYFLPASSSDFIFAVIVEEWGSLGGGIVVVVYLFLLLQILRIATRTDDVFGSLVVIGFGLSIVFQAFINIGVAVNLLPVTGQTLPLISSGGSSIWITCIMLGIVVSVSRGLEHEKVADEFA